MTSSRATKKQGFSMLESSSENEEEEEEGMIPKLPQPQPQLIWGGVGGKKKVLRKQLSMRETKRELKWEKRKKQMYLRSLRGKIDGASEEVLDGEVKGNGMVRSLTDEDLDELRGSIELGFGFNEENGGHDLCRTLPALNLYFAVNRQFSDPNMQLSTPSPASTPTATATSSATSSASTLYGTPSPRSPYGQPNQERGTDGWKIINPGDSPQDVKTKLRHWAQVVACSVRQCC
ncbi:hypothetical protein IEQ34_016000 [Dendrobium chrysotoxum]|uniref:Uncharacterized protein n=1 Tax=Dendrobium chrysotoxum TaxID=161865 RepID=A0AAV7GJU6_DENCH|nr:hypothetical protein IEQ34_016000 [Dendrobium chrysotoxum]